MIIADIDTKATNTIRRLYRDTKGFTIEATTQQQQQIKGLYNKANNFSYDIHNREGLHTFHKYALVNESYIR